MGKEELNQGLKEKLCSVLSEEDIRINEKMKDHTTFKVGGPADYFVTPNTEEEAARLLRLLFAEKIPFFILGNGSNVLVSDNGYRGVMVQMFKNYDDIIVEGNKITAKAGALLSKIAAKALEEALTGMEFASGIPGTLGGAVFMNAGAYGGEMKQIVSRVKLYDIQNDEIIYLSNDEMDFSYRHSILKERNCLVLEAELILEPGNKEDIHTKMEELKAARIEKQPLNYPSAGSTFKRPEGYFAGKLIQDAGLKGASVGGAMVSEKHSGFIVNTGEATASDILSLIKNVKDKVQSQFGVELEPEVLIIGEDSI